MSLDDLYGKRGYLQGRISACERKIGELEKTNKRLEKEKKEMEEDVKSLNTINGKIGKIVSWLKLSVTYIGNARDSISSYYNGFSTKSWKGTIGKAHTSTSTLIKNFGNIKKEADGIIKKLKEEIEKRKKSIEQNEKTIKSTRQEMEDLKDDLADVNYDIEHYDDNDD